MLYPNSFRTDAVGDVHFALRVDARDGGQVPDWSMGSNIQTYTVPGSDPPIVVEDRINHLPSQVTWRLALPSRADYRKLLLMRGQVGTLTVVAGLQSHLGTTITVDAVAYDLLSTTTLLAVSRTAREIGGTFEVDVTFQRVEDTSAYVIEPLMLLPLDGDLTGRDRDGTFAATDTGTVSFVPGYMADLDAASEAVLVSDSPDGHVTLPAAYIDPDQGTLGVRVLWSIQPGTSVSAVRIGDTSPDRVMIRRAPDNRIDGHFGDRAVLNASDAITVPNATWATIWLDWEDGDVRLWLGTELINATTYSTPPDVDDLEMVLGTDDEDYGGTVAIAEVVTYDYVIADDERALLTSSWRWAWSALVRG